MLCDSYTNPKKPTLYGCACRCDVTRALEMIRAGAELEASGQGGQTALHYAGWKNTPDLAAALLDAGANINARDSYDRTPLHYAACYARLPMIQLLADRGADLNAKAKGNATPLCYCCTTTHLEAVSALLSSGADPNYVADTGYTILMGLCQSGLVVGVRSLLDYGADPNIGRDGYGFTCLHWAAFRGYEKIARMLLERGAVSGALSDSVPLGEGAALTVPKTERHRTPAQIASERRHPRTADLIQNWS